MPLRGAVHPIMEALEPADSEQLVAREVENEGYEADANEFQHDEGDDAARKMAVRDLFDRDDFQRFDDGDGNQEKRQGATGRETLDSPGDEVFELPPRDQVCGPMAKGDSAVPQPRRRGRRRRRW